MSQFARMLTDGAALRAQLIQSGALRPRPTGRPVLTAFRNIGAEPVVKMDAAGRRAAQRAQSATEAERELFGRRDDK